jgi:hypothetical protein
MECMHHDRAMLSLVCLVLEHMLLIQEMHETRRIGTRWTYQAAPVMPLQTRGVCFGYCAWETWSLCNNIAWVS